MRGTKSDDDLLHAEALAHQLLQEHGVPVAETVIVETARRTYLQSTRFDRLGAAGRRHVVPLDAVHHAFVPGARQNWGATCEALAAQRRLPPEVPARVRALQAFGRLIANTDMHFANLSLFVEAADVPRGRFTLAPLYDMLPMRWRPDPVTGSLDLYAFEPEASDLASAAQPIALEFWGRWLSTALQVAPFAAWLARWHALLPDWGRAAAAQATPHCPPARVRDTPAMLSATSRIALGYTSMLVHSFVRRGMLRREAVRDALVRQIHFTGVRALPYVTVVALLFGAIGVTRVLAILGAENETALKTIVGGAIRELGPLVTALIVIVRSSVAIAAEVGLMRLSSGISAELWKDRVHEEEVVLPRVLGVAIACALLVSVFQVVAIGSALAATALTLDTAFITELEEFLLAAEWWQVPVSLAKGAMFGAGIAAIACYHGLHVEPEIGEIPRAVVAACVGSLSFVIALDLFAVLLLLA